MDRRHGNLDKRIRVQEIRKLNKLEESSVEDSLSFPIELLYTVLTAFPRTLISNTSSGSGVIPPHVSIPETM